MQMQLAKRLNKEDMQPDEMDIALLLEEMVNKHQNHNDAYWEETILRKRALVKSYKQKRENYVLGKQKRFERVAKGIKTPA